MPAIRLILLVTTTGIAALAHAGNSAVPDVCSFSAGSPGRAAR
jgi:hypothetical protein